MKEFNSIRKRVICSRSVFVTGAAIFLGVASPATAEGCFYLTGRALHDCWQAEAQKQAAANRAAAEQQKPQLDAQVAANRQAAQRAKAEAEAQAAANRRARGY